MKILILVLLLVTKQYRAGKAPSLTSLVKFEQCQADNLGHVFLHGNDVSLRKCAAHCSKKEWCKGLAFVKNVMLCSLYNNMTLWEKRQSTRGDCAVIYKENLTEMNFVDIPLEELKECDEFVSVPNGIVLGNMNREGNRKQVVCNEWFKIQSGSDVSQCLNGKWTPKPACVLECQKGWEKYGNACYRLFTQTAMTADAANEFCKSVNAKLMTISTDDDKDYLSTRAGNVGWKTWTGLKMKEGRLKNIYTNETVVITNMCNIEQSSSVDQTCVTVAVDGNKSYAYCVYANSCSSVFLIVCKKAFDT
ncbi:hypothetical protein DPMN_173361 [Dreissena polymorpha]|uniref:Uncharacterized protein n=1 Tax=Dreissena polymorpha TaxID=45954 RepID=A0A9D4E3Y8_DREPO|nr:hypothetical protein DPMN_173361 [Dreissena polymorpha]